MGGSPIIPIDAVCTFKIGGFLRRRQCGAEASGQCVYCGAPFCAEHGEHGPDYYEVCVRERCRAKWADLAAHREWVAHQYQVNLTGYCAAEGCEQPQDIPCERCHLKFCQPHVRVMTVKVSEIMGDTMRSQLLCPHCVQRRKIWD